MRNVGQFEKKNVPKPTQAGAANNTVLELDLKANC